MDSHEHDHEYGALNSRDCPCKSCRAIYGGASVIRSFESGATRDSEDGKLDFDGFLSHAVLHRYAEYMHKHRKQADGTMRPSDNWKKGIPREVYMKSMFRHFMDVWDWHLTTISDGFEFDAHDEMEEALCALMFNVMGYLFELEMGR